MLMSKAFDEYKAIRFPRLAKQSCQKATYVLETFKDFLAERPAPKKTLEGISVREVEGYLAYLLQKRGLSKATANCHYRTLKAFFRWCESYEFITKAPTARVCRIPEERRNPRVLSEDEIQKLLTYLEGNRVRYADMAKFILNMGLRLGEALFLQVKDIDWDRGLLNVVNKPDHALKDKQDRVLKLNEAALEILQRRRLRCGKDPEGYLFGSQQRVGRPLNLKTASGRFKRFTAAAGVPEANWQMLRRTCLTRCAEIMAPMQLAAFAGHSDVQTTDSFYIARNVLRMPPPPEVA